jgi:hypothetical protein
METGCGSKKQEMNPDLFDPDSPFLNPTSTVLMLKIQKFQIWILNVLFRDQDPDLKSRLSCNRMAESTYPRKFAQVDKSLSVRDRTTARFFKHL